MYKWNKNPVKNQSKKTRKRRYITKGNVFLPELNLQRENQHVQMAGLCQ